MIKREGHYILTIEDWQTIIKYFMLTPRTVAIHEVPDLTFIEYQARDIYTKKILFSFYNHDGKIRIPGDNKTIAYEIDISQILTKNPNMPPQHILDSVKSNARKSRKTFANRIKSTEKTTKRKVKQSDETE